MRGALRAALDRARLTPARAALVAVLAAAFVARVWALRAGVPHAVGIDEPAIVTRVLRILNTGDWNPHVFDYPTLVIYLHAAVALLRFMVGASRGEWASLGQLDLAAIYAAGRFVSAAIATATVWLTYRIGREAGSERIGLLAAGQLAILPMHVRESHFILTDVPLTALTTLTVYLSMRLDRVRAVWAGVAGGLAAAAKYNGGLVMAAVFAAALMRRVPIGERLLACAAAAAGAAAAFLIATPYAVLDLPTFLDSFAAQMGRFAQSRLSPEPVWLTYLKHFALSGRAWLPLAVVGLVVVCGRRAARARWVPVLAFVAVYFYVLAGSSVVFARYALPLTPMICLLAAAGMDALARLLLSVPGLRRPVLRCLAVALLLLPLAVPFARGVVGWQRHAMLRDTRQVTADWLKASVPRGTRLAVENNGPTHLPAAGFEVVDVAQLTARPLDWYAQQKIEYLVVSSTAAWGQGYADAGVKVIDVPTTPQRQGPSIRVVRIGGM